jgi:beta-aspartyl-peptidase (threonine type)
MQKSFSIAIHGGAGTILQSLMTAEKETAYKNALSSALNEAYDILSKGGTSLNAVEAAVIVLENSPLFNAGKGSVFTHLGKHEMDASIMCGKTRNAGAAGMLSGVKNPVKVARLIMEKSGHVFLAGDGANLFAKEHGIEFESDDYFFDQLRYDQWQHSLNSDVVMLDHSPLDEKKFGTVGAVALDMHGNLAAATSTGGMTNKKFGRLGDSPVIGAGTYANNETCAVSCTGSGEYFIRGVVAYDVSCLMEYRGLSLQEACDQVVHERLLKLGGDGGLIAADAKGNVHLSFNTEGMYRASRNSLGLEYIGIYK